MNETTNTNAKQDPSAFFSGVKANNVNASGISRSDSDLANAFEGLASKLGDMSPIANENVTRRPKRVSVESIPEHMSQEDTRMAKMMAAMVQQLTKTNAGDPYRGGIPPTKRPTPRSHPKQEGVWRPK